MTDATTRAKRLLPLHDDSAPIMCTIGDDERAARVALLERMRRAVARIERTHTGILLQFARDDSIEADVRRFAIDEKRCCRFWGLAVVDGDDEVVLRWDAPPSAATLLDSIERVLRGDTPIEEIQGLL